MAEKKAAILERGLQHSRSEPRLLLALLDAAAPLLDAEGLNSRWIQVIRRWQALDTHNCAIGTAMLWSEYLRLRREQFALFRVPRLQVCGHPCCLCSQLRLFWGYLWDFCTFTHFVCLLGLLLASKPQ